MPRPKKPESSPTVQMGIRLSRELRDQLEKAGGERGIAEEIRRRLEMTFMWDEGLFPGQVDPQTRELAAAVGDVADNLTAFGDWWADRFAFDALREAINIVLTERFQPPENAKLNDKNRSAKDLGQTIATLWLKQHREQKA